jgi:hypothetical protein
MGVSRMERPNPRWTIERYAPEVSTSNVGSGKNAPSLQCGPRSYSLCPYGLRGAVLRDGQNSSFLAPVFPVALSDRSRDDDGVGVGALLSSGAGQGHSLEVPSPQAEGKY